MATIYFLPSSFCLLLDPESKVRDGKKSKSAIPDPHHWISGRPSKIKWMLLIKRFHLLERLLVL